MIMRNEFKLCKKSQLDEIVFQNRNKSYGAYTLRQDYSRDLTKALLVGVGLFAMLALVPAVISSFSKIELPKPTQDLKPFELSDVDEDVIIPKEQIITHQKLKSVNSIVPTPSRIVSKEAAIPNKKESENAIQSFENTDGEIVLNPSASLVSQGETSVGIVVTLPAKVVDPEKVFSSSDADVAASYKGGIDAFRQKVISNFNTNAVETDVLLSAVVSFIVEKDGSISHLKVDGANVNFNREAERTIQSIKNKWTPAKYHGKSVRSSFRMPISMKIE